MTTTPRLGQDTDQVSAVPAGNWTLSSTVRTTAIDEYTDQLTLPIR